MWSPIDNAKSLFGRPNAGRASMNAGILDGLRVLATLWVISNHVIGYAWILPNSTDGINQMGTENQFYIFYSGGYGVDIFFLLSGFLIFNILYREFEKDIDIKDFLQSSFRFYGRRFFRIYPSYMVALGLWCLILTLTPNPLSMQQLSLCQQYWWTNVLAINNYYPVGDVASGCMGWTWTIAIELQMYFVSPPIVFLVFKQKRWGRTILLLLTLVSVGFYFGYTLSDLIYFPELDLYPINVYPRFYTRFYTYTLGMLVAFQFIQGGKQLNLTVRCIFRVLTTSIIIAIAFFENINYPGWQEKYIWMMSLNREVLCFCLAFVMYDLLLGPVEGKRFANMWIPVSCYLLSNRITYTLSQLTYNIYLYHLCVIYIFYALIFQIIEFTFTPSWMMITFVLCCFIISGILALVIYFLFEKLLINFGSKYLKRKTLPTPEMIELMEKSSVSSSEQEESLKPCDVIFGVNTTNGTFFGGSTTSVIYGDSSDGDVTIASNIVLAKDMYYRNLTINDGGMLRTNGFRVFVTKTLTLANISVITNAGTNGTSSSPGVAPPDNSVGGGGSLTVGRYIGGNGGSQGSITRPTVGNGYTNGEMFCFHTLPCMMTARDLSSAIVRGGVSGNSTNYGGGGGIIYIAARYWNVTGSPTITAKGGNASGLDAGGGGGYILIVTDQSSIIPTLDVSGGIGLSVGEAGGYMIVSDNGGVLLSSARIR